MTSVISLVAGVGVSAYLFGSATRRLWTEDVGLALTVASFVTAPFVGAPELPLWLTVLLVSVAVLLGPV
jgi:hypothetical protein